MGGQNQMGDRRCGAQDLSVSLSHFGAQGTGFAATLLQSCVLPAETVAQLTFLVQGYVGGDPPVLIHTLPGGLVLTKETAPESHQKSEMNCQKEIREQNDPSLLHLLMENET